MSFASSPDTNPFGCLKSRTLLCRPYFSKACFAHALEQIPLLNSRTHRLYRFVGGIKNSSLFQRSGQKVHVVWSSALDLSSAAGKTLLLPLVRRGMVQDHTFPFPPFSE